FRNGVDLLARDDFPDADAVPALGDEGLAIRREADEVGKLTMPQPRRAESGDGSLRQRVAVAIGAYRLLLIRLDLAHRFGRRLLVLLLLHRRSLRRQCPV